MPIERSIRTPVAARERLTALSVAVSLACASSALRAQDADADATTTDEPTETVIVTGSRTSGLDEFTSASPVQVLTTAELRSELGSRATLVQFSSAFCSPCRATRTLLRDVTARLDDVAYIDLDAESHLDLVRQLGVVRTPTVVVLDPTLSSHLSLTTATGLYLEHLDPDSGFRRLGLREGDVLVALGSERLEGSDDAERLIEFLRSGARGILFVERDGQMGRVEVR